MVPSVIQIETAFKRLSTDSSQTFTVKNYDGSESRRTVTKHRDGTETVAEVTTYPNGEQVAKETIRHLTTGKTSKCCVQIMGPNLYIIKGHIPCIPGGRNRTGINST